MREEPPKALRERELLRFEGRVVVRFGVLRLPSRLEPVPRDVDGRVVGRLVEGRLVEGRLVVPRLPIRDSPPVRLRFENEPELVRPRNDSRAFAAVWSR